jgi:hypothetical protein
MLLGYARVSQDTQDHALQLDAFTLRDVTRCSWRPVPVVVPTGPGLPN